MAAVLANTELGWGVFPWLAVAMLVSLARLGLWLIHRHAGRRFRQSCSWAALIMSGAVAAGLVWGLGSVLLLPRSETYQLLWVFVIGGMCAGTVALNFAYLPAVLGFILPAALPLAADFAVQGGGRHRAAAAMIGVFLAALLETSRRSSSYFGEMVRLRMELAERTRELESTNQRLRAEMAQHAETEASLRHARKMEALGQLTSGLAHDFSNLLMAVQSSLETLRGRIQPGSQPHLRLLDTAIQGTERGVALTKRLLAVGRQQMAQNQVVDAAALIRSMSTLLHSSLGSGVRITLRFPDQLSPIEVDPNQLELALLNLAVNARDAMPEGGTIAIEAREEEIADSEDEQLPEGAYVVLHVEDEGEGMDEVTLARAMEPFFTTKDVGKGTGLGLHMVHGFAAESGGKFVLRSRKGQGTIAELWLPRAEIVPESVAPLPPASARTVLVVDDDSLVLSTTVSMLDDLGYSTIAASSGEEALELLRARPGVDLVVTDQAMPGMSGEQLAKCLQLIRPELPVLLASGDPGLEDDGSACRGRLQKPFRQKALQLAVAECLHTVEG